ncbi:MAG TPA: hypothetical protein VGI95_01110 [Caulobacteraceae bacterium]|jgi:hypothetical protein
MIRALVIAALLTGLAGCATDGPEGSAWYEHGNADYDSLKTATDACKGKGGVFTLKPGGDPTHLGDYDCKIGKGT